MRTSARPMRRALHVLVALGMPFAPMGLHAQDGSALPPAREIIARYAKAVGGDGWKSHKSARMKATVEVPGAGMSASMEVMTVFPNASISVISLAGIGEIKTGFDGTTAWSMDPVMGPRVLAGREADQLREQSDPDASLRTSPNIVSSETVGKATMNGQECYQVKETWKSGSVSTDCFAIADGYLIATTSKVQTPMGEMEQTTYHSEYKDFGGVKQPTVVTQEANGQKSTMTVTSWEWDTVEAKSVEPPAEIKALVGKKP